MAELRYAMHFQDLSFYSFITKCKVGLLMIFGLRKTEVSDGLGVQSQPGFWYDDGQIIYLESLLGGIIIKYVKTPSTEPMYSNLVPP